MDKRLHLPLKKNKTKKGGGGAQSGKTEKKTNGIVISELYIYKGEVAINTRIIVLHFVLEERL